MNKYRLLLFLSIAVVFSLLAGCTGGAAITTSWPGITVDTDNNTLYVSFNTHIYAVNLGNGTEKWRFPATADNKITFFAESTLTDDGQLLAGAYNDVLYSINPENGNQNWTFNDSENIYVAGALYSNNNIFAPSSDNSLYTITLDGNLRWQAATQHSLWATPVSDGEYVYQASMDHHLYIYDIETGTEVWKSEDLGGTMIASPVISSEGILYQGTFGNEIIALDTSNREILWRFPTQGWVWSAPALENGTLFFGDLEGTVYAVNSADGSLIWQIQPNISDDRGIFGRPLVVEDSLYFASRGGILYSVDKTNGSPKWSKTFEAQFFSNLLNVEDMILLSSNKSDAFVIAVDLNGNQRWSFTPAE